MHRTLLPWLLVLAACNGSGDADKSSADPTDASDDCFTLADGRCVEETFANPPVLQPDGDGVYQLDLAATEVMLNGERHCVRSYNGDYTGPTIDVAARQGDAERQIRVDMANHLQDHDYRSLYGDVCTCTDGAGAECLPAHVHDRCVPEDTDCTCRNEDGEVCEHMFDFNVTNLHFHGSHVRPDWARGGEACDPVMKDGIFYDCRECSTNTCEVVDHTCFHGDNVLNAVHPGTGARYRWDIDEDGTHHTGLQWYHPHIHGTTAIQVASGASGALIVRGPLDALPGIADARERVMLFTTPSIANNGFEPLEDGEACSDETITFNGFDTLSGPTTPQMNILNGQRRPRLVTAPGQVERWRILHAGFLDEVYLGLFRGSADCETFSTAPQDTLHLIQIGRDGLILPQPFEDDYFFMSPGYRIEGMLGGPGVFQHGDTWCLVAARALQPADEDSFGEFGEQPFHPIDPPTPEAIFARFEQDGDVVAILDVTEDAGPPTETQLPNFADVAAEGPSLTLGGVSAEDRCAEAAAVTDPKELDQVAVLQVGFWTVEDPDPCGCESYNVNCHNFEVTDRSRYPVDRDLPLDAVEHWRVSAAFDGHPFHIHINPFIVCPNDNPFDPLPFPHWRDTYLANMARRVDVLTEYKSYTGAFVFHCHKLTHEDHGMMEVMRVCDPNEDETCGDYGWRSCAPDDLQCVQQLAATDCAVGTHSELEEAACAINLGSPMGVCGPNACIDDLDCDDGATCTDNVCERSCATDDDCPITDRCDPLFDACLPAPCIPGCLPGDTCVHGSCQ